MNQSNWTGLKHTNRSLAILVLLLLLLHAVEDIRAGCGLVILEASTVKTNRVRSGAGVLCCDPADSYDSYSDLRLFRTHVYEVIDHTFKEGSGTHATASLTIDKNIRKETTWTVNYTQNMLTNDYYGTDGCSRILPSFVEVGTNISTCVEYGSTETNTLTQVLVNGNWEPPDTNFTCITTTGYSIGDGTNSTTICTPTRITITTPHTPAGAGERRTEETVGDEYTRAELEANLMSDLASLPDGQNQNCLAVASFNLSEHGVCAEAQRLKYSYKYLGPRDAEDDIVIMANYSVTYRGPITESITTNTYTTNYDETVTTYETNLVPGIVWTDTWSEIAVSNHVTYTGHPQSSSNYTIEPIHGAGPNNSVIRQSTVTFTLLKSGSCGGMAGFRSYQAEMRDGPWVAFGLSSGCSENGGGGEGFLFMQGDEGGFGGLETFINGCLVKTAGSPGNLQYGTSLGVCTVTNSGQGGFVVSYYSGGAYNEESGVFENLPAPDVTYAVAVSENSLRIMTGAWDAIQGAKRWPSPIQMGEGARRAGEGLPVFHPTDLLITPSTGGYTEFILENGCWSVDYGTGTPAEAWCADYSEDGEVEESTYQILNEAGQPIFQENSQYTQPPGMGAPKIMTRTTGLGADAQTEYFFYNTNVAINNTNFGKLSMKIQANGGWERYEYDNTTGFTTKRVAGFGNSWTNAAESASRVTEYSYTPFHSSDDGSIQPNTARRTTEWVKGSRVSMTGTAYWPDNHLEVRFAGQHLGVPANWNEPENLKTLTTDLSFTRGAGTKTVLPDSTMSFSYTMTNAAGDYRTNLTITGQSDGADSITNGVETLVVFCISSNRTERRINYNISGGQVMITGDDVYEYPGPDPRSYTITHLDGSTEAVNYSTCCGAESSVDRDGVTTSNYYDSRRRQIATLRLGVMTSNVLDNAGNVLETWRVPASSAAIRLAAYTYDTAGRQRTMLNALNHGTTNGYRILGDGRTVNSTTNADGSYREEYVNRDGSVDRVLGTAVFPAQYAYDVDTSVDQLYTVETKLDIAGNPTSEWTSSYTDALGGAYKQFFAAPGGQSNPYTLERHNNLGQRDASRDADGNWTYYYFDGKGQLVESSIDMDATESPRNDGVDRTTSTSSSIVRNDNNDWVRRTTSTLLGESGVPDAIADISLDGLTSWSVSFGRTNKSVRSPADSQTGVRTVTTTAPDGTSTVSTYTLGRLTLVVRYDASTPANVLGSTSYEYDSHGRQWKTTDARNGATTYGFNDADQITAITNPPAATGQSALVVRTDYDSMGRATTVTQADSTTVSTSFYPNGLVKRTWGSRTYPVEYAYDHQGRLTNMITWQSFASDAGKANTAWDYDGYRGFFIGKRYQGQAGPTYTNTPGGRLQKRTWARDNLSSTYSYNPAGQITGIDYSDATAEVANFYNHRGYLSASTWGTNSLTNTLLVSGMIASQKINGGTIVVNAFDEFQRRTNVHLYKLISGVAKVASRGFLFNPAGRLDAVTDGTNSATYSYIANSPLVEQIAFKRSGTTRMTTTKSFDKLNRLTQIRSVDAQSAPVASFDYNYNPASQRTSVTNADGSFWSYSYDALGQVTSGRKSWSDGTPVLGQQFDYTFDDIGNRKTAVTGGDQWGANKRYQNYTSTLLNQYTNRTVSGYVDVVGTANSNATVTVQSSTGVAPASRKREYFRAEVAAQNSSAPVWLGVTNVATLTNGSNTDIVTNATGRLLLVQTPEVFVHDLDGNLLRDGQWTNSWDAENRLIAQETLAAVYGAGAPRQRLEFDYDPLGRRMVKRAYDWVSGNWSLKYAVRFVWDGWNLLAELNPTNHLGIRSYAWGSDLSGSTQGAGGVGGLLWVAEHGTAQPSVHFAAFDGNGNVAALMDAVAGTVSANYEYGPFGETIRSTGPLAKANPLRFSTKYQEDETGCLYYGYRSYNATMGRWPNRDPIGERGGRNLYAFVLNRPIDAWDLLGLTKPTDVLDKFFGPDDEGLWLMGEDDEYTKHMREWIAVQQAVDKAKKDLAANCSKWESSHKTSPYWHPFITSQFSPDRASYRVPVSGPPGTNPGSAIKDYAIYGLTGHITDNLWYSAVGSFTVCVTVDKIDCCGKAKLNVWVYNAMTQQSFGPFSDVTPGKQANQYMWWHWTEDYYFGTNAGAGGSSGGGGSKGGGRGWPW